MEQCQICGKKTGLKSDGTIRHHHRQSQVCAGSSQKPWSLSCEVIDTEIARFEERDRYWSSWLSKYLKGNMPPASAEMQAMASVSKTLAKLRGRRKHWEKRNWVEYWCAETETFKKRPPDHIAA